MTPRAPHQAATPSHGAAPREKRIALVGQPNVGKSVLFHLLTGTYVTVSNFPGTTVDVIHGRGRGAHRACEVWDTPGANSLHPRSDDERVARDLLLELKPDAVIQVADAKHLPKALHLTLELAEFGLPMVLALNMSDERRDRGIDIDCARLSARLGIPVVETVAVTGEGMAELWAAVEVARPPRITPRYDPELERRLTQIDHHLGDAPDRRAIATALFAQDASAWRHAAVRAQTGHLGAVEAAVSETRDAMTRLPEMLLFEARQAVVQEILGETFSTPRPGGRSWAARIGMWTMRPLPGAVVAAATLTLLYQFVGVFGAGTLVDFLEERVFGGVINPLVARFVDAFVPTVFLQDLLVGEYGLMTMALTYALALILPIVTTFFLFFGILEDSGYLPRLAVMMDRLFRLMGLNGRAVLPMVLGLGCDTMATVTTRILDTRKEKIIVSLLLTLAVPCSAQLGVILGMAAGLSWKVLAVWFSVVAGAMMAVGWGANRVLPGGRAPFLVELPPLRVPKLANITKKVRARLTWYLKEVLPLFMVATLALFLLDKMDLLGAIERAFAPVVVTFLGLPAAASEAFLIGFFRRDYGAAGFFDMAKAGLLDPRQSAVAMVVITLFMPCVAHVLITAKERGWRVAAVILAFVMAFALAVGGGLNHVLQRVPIF